MYRTREYRRDVRNRKIARKKRVSKEIYNMDWFPIDGKYSKGHIGCGCKICKFSKHYNSLEKKTSSDNISCRMNFPG